MFKYDTLYKLENKPGGNSSISVPVIFKTRSGFLEKREKASRSTVFKFLPVISRCLIFLFLRQASCWSRTVSSIRTFNILSWFVVARRAHSCCWKFSIRGQVCMVSDSRCFICDTPLLSNFSSLSSLSMFRVWSDRNPRKLSDPISCGHNNFMKRILPWTLNF